VSFQKMIEDLAVVMTALCIYDSLGWFVGVLRKRYRFYKRQIFLNKTF